MERTRELWGKVNYPPTENEIKYNKIMMDYDLFDEIVSDVCRQTRINESEIIQKTKNNYVTTARYLIYYLAKVAGYKPSEIIRLMSSMGHEVANSTIVYGVYQIEKKMVHDKKLDNYVSEFLVRLEY